MAYTSAAPNAEKVSQLGMRWQWTSRSTAKKRKAAAHPRMSSGIDATQPLSHTGAASRMPTAAAKPRWLPSEGEAIGVVSELGVIVSSVIRWVPDLRTGLRGGVAGPRLQVLERRLHVPADEREDDRTDRDHEAADDRPLDGLETALVANEALDCIQHVPDLLRGLRHKGQAGSLSTRTESR